MGKRLSKIRGPMVVVPLLHGVVVGGCGNKTCLHQGEKLNDSCCGVFSWVGSGIWNNRVTYQCGGALMFEIERND